MKNLIILALDDAPTRQLLSRALCAVNYETALVNNDAGIHKLLRESKPVLVLMSAHFQNTSSLPLIEKLFNEYPTLPIIYLADKQAKTEIRQVLQSGVSAYLEPPLQTDEIVEAIQQSLMRANRLGDWLRQRINKSTSSLEKELSEWQILIDVNREINSSLNLDEVLKKVVQAAVELTKAEEGSLLLLSEDGTELYMRAGHNFEQGFADSFRISVADSIAGQVVKSGRPITYNKSEAHKIQTSYLIQGLIYVPLKVREQIIGVLGVDNRLPKMPFSDRDILLLSLLAEDAASAIENARLYQHTVSEQQKFETVIANMNDALLMLDMESRIQIINPSMAKALDLQINEIIGKKASDVLPPGDMLNLINNTSEDDLQQYEINIGDERAFSAQYIQIPNVGVAITMQDISYFKKVNRMKDDFVHTVSHDLRSPLTAVLGYTELLERVGEMNKTQKDFVQRIQESVENITSLIDELLDLGRIEAGFNADPKVVRLEEIIEYTLLNFEGLYKQKEQIIETELAPNLPPLHGNPLRLRQMCDNLIANAIKYTKKGGKICIKLHAHQNELILNVSDEGPGIPREDQPHIFEKFYRASNAIGKEDGSGLGLAIVKTIVENHHGRTWVESTLGKGSNFVVVLPAIKQTRTT